MNAINLEVDNHQPMGYTIGVSEGYETLEGKTVPLGRLNGQEKSFLGEMLREYESGRNFLNFKLAYSEPDSIVYRSAKRLRKPVEESPLYRVCDDLARRLGVKQGYLVKEEIMEYQAMPMAERKEMTTGQVAKLAGCSSQAVWKAILTWRLRARKVGRLALIWEEDAKAFAASRRRSAKKAGKSRGKELAHA